MKPFLPILILAKMVLITAFFLQLAHANPAPHPNITSLNNKAGQLEALDKSIEKLEVDEQRLALAQDVYLQRIDALKAAGGGGLFDGLRLDRMLRSSKELADRRHQLAAEVETQQAQRRNLRAEILNDIQTTQAELGTEPPEEEDGREAWIANHQALVALRQRLQSRHLPETLIAGGEELPNGSSFTSSPTDGPDELLELADEARDEEQRLRERADILTHRIKELKDRMLLAQLAGRMEREESLFDEGARFQRSSTPRSQQQRPAVGDSDDNQEELVGSDPAESDRSANPPEESAGGWDGSNEDDGSFYDGIGNESPSDPLPGGQPEAAPELGDPSPPPPPQTEEPMGETDAHHQRTLGFDQRTLTEQLGHIGSYDVATQIDILEETKRNTERAASDLARRQRELQQRARRLQQMHDELP